MQCGPTMSQRLKSKIAIVTGAGRNIGRAIAERFAAEGASVLIVDVDEDSLSEVDELIKKRGGVSEPLVADLSSAEEVERLVPTAVDTFGGLDIVVNNAYAGPYKKLTDQDNEGWEKALAIGLTAPMIVCRAAIPHLQRRGGGSLVNIGSINSIRPNAPMAAYSAVKGGLVNLTRNIAVTYGPLQIRCNAICPGYITHSQRNAMFREKPLEKERVLSTLPMRRLGVPDDIAHAAVFLASDESAFINGHSLYVDGGSTVQNAVMPTFYFEQALRREMGDAT